MRRMNGGTDRPLRGTRQSPVTPQCAIATSLRRPSGSMRTQCAGARRALESQNSKAELTTEAQDGTGELGANVHETFLIIRFLDE